MTYNCNRRTINPRMMMTMMTMMMAQNTTENAVAAGALPHIPLGGGGLQCSPRFLTGFSGASRQGKQRWENQEIEKGKERTEKEIHTRLVSVWWRSRQT